jgi:hypothetical protein
VNIPKKKEFFFQDLAVAQLPILPEMRVDTLHQLQIKVGVVPTNQCRLFFINELPEWV